MWFASHAPHGLRTIRHMVCVTLSRGLRLICLVHYMVCLTYFLLDAQCYFCFVRCSMLCFRPVSHLVCVPYVMWLASHHCPRHVICVIYVTQNLVNLWDSYQPSFASSSIKPKQPSSKLAFQVKVVSQLCHYYYLQFFAHLRD